ncbi:hypothetical protein A6V39_03385 [Candidatus Mycoplasma haematobovis]|uniref:Uncharacterized protein n=1 Tax=Candidatus Mycoplasma haematobovis TaxID=432608 RepID=A0A1A9QCG4_9MOLU|nr:hypothetical protein [Candidatus Mycoplasma haematobovis]OAL09928.1 hypothetical protein A6V39_03385 [Candidatus Mycoplasma haematobovis]
MQTGTKILSIVAGMGVVGSVSALASHLLTATKVSDVLRKQGHTFLNFDSDLDTWKTIAKAYSNSQKNRLTGLTITIASDGQATEDDAKKLRKACKDVIYSSNHKDKSLLLATEQWCVKPITIRDLAKAQGEVLDTNIAQDNQQDRWNEKVADYIREGATDKISSVDLTAHTPHQPAEDRKKLKQGCNSLEGKHNYDVDFHDNFTKFQKWCTPN